jgi:hypothetical protein
MLRLMQRAHRGVFRSQLCLDLEHAVQDRRRVWRILERQETISGALEDRKLVET